MDSNKKPTPSPADSQSPKALGAHPEQKRLEGSPVPGALRGHTPDDDVVVPAVTADVDETSPVVKYGAAILLGLAFGVGCYVWVDGGVPSDRRDTSGVAPAPTEAYFTQYGAYDDPALAGTLPDPFVSPFEPSLDRNATAMQADMRLAALSESVEPVAPGDYSADLDEAAVPAQSETDASAAASDASLPEDMTVVYLFAYDSSAVPQSDQLDEIARRAAASGVTLNVNAYTDSRGRDAYNRRLSERRARAVGDYLVAHGVPADHVKVYGRGATDAYADYAQDRRAEVTVAP